MPKRFGAESSREIYKFGAETSSLEFPPLSICVNIYALRLGSYYFNPTEYRWMNIAHPLCAGYKNRLLIYTYAQCDYANHDLALNWYM